MNGDGFDLGALFDEPDKSECRQGGPTDDKLPQNLRREDLSLPEKFERNSHLAADRAAEILGMPLDRASPAYATELRTVAATANEQMRLQLRADETALKERKSKDVLDLILAAIAVEEVRRGPIGDAQRRVLTPERLMALQSSGKLHGCDIEMLKQNGFALPPAGGASVD